MRGISPAPLFYTRVYDGSMGFWKKLGTIVGRVAVQAGIGALEAKASGKPITIGTVGPGVLGDVLRREAIQEEAFQLPVPDQEGLIAVAYEAPVSSRRSETRIRYFTDMQLAREFAKEMAVAVLVSVDTGDGLDWSVDVLKRRSEVPPAPPAPPAVLDIWEGDIRPGEVTVGYLAVWYRVDGKVGYRRIRYFTDLESAWQFADEKKSKVMRLAETDGRKHLVELEREKA